MPALLRLAWPVVLARATQSVVGFTDALMVAPLGEDALAAATTGAINAFLLIILPMGTVFIVQSFAAQLRGRGNVSAVVRYAWYGLILAGLAALLAAASLPAIAGLLAWFDYDPSVHALMSSYLSVRLLSVGFVVGCEALGNWYGGLGNTRPAMVAGLVTMLTNIPANFLLIQPRWGLPGYGVEGAAWASVLGSVFGFLVLFIPFLRGAGYQKPSAPLKLRFDELWRVLRFGLPNGANWFLEFASFTLFINLFVAELGTTALAAFSVVMQINSVAFMPAFGVASAGAIFVGEAIGRCAHQQVLAIVKLTCRVTVAWMLSVGLLYLLIPEWLMGWFQPQGVPAHALVRTGVTMLMLSAVWQLFDALGLTLAEALRAAGDTAWCMGARILLAWFVFLPAAWIGLRWFDGDIVGVMLIVAGYVLLVAVAMAARFTSGRWRDIKLVEEFSSL